MFTIWRDDRWSMVWKLCYVIMTSIHGLHFNEYKGTMLVRYEESREEEEGERRRETQLNYKSACGSGLHLLSPYVLVSNCLESGFP